MKTSCLHCEVPSGRVVHPASVYVSTTREMMSMDLEWHSGPHSRLPGQLVHLINRIHCGLRYLSHQQRQRHQQLWQTVHTQPEQLTVQGSKSRQLKWSDLGFSVSASMRWQGDDRNLFRVFCETDVKSAPCSGVFCRRLVCFVRRTV